MSAAICTRQRTARGGGIIDLLFLAWRGGDHHARVSRRRATQLHEEVTDNSLPSGEAVIVDQVLPYRNRVPQATERLDDQLAIRLTR